MQTKRKEELQETLKEANKLAATISIIVSSAMCICNILILQQDVFWTLLGCITGGFIGFIVLKKFYHRCILKHWEKDSVTSNKAD